MLRIIACITIVASCFGTSHGLFNWNRGRTYPRQLQRAPTVAKCGAPLYWNPARFGSSFMTGVIVKYSCVGDYVLYGPASITCLKNGQWSGQGSYCSKDNGKLRYGAVESVKKSPLASPTQNNGFDVKDITALLLQKQLGFPVRGFLGSSAQNPATSEQSFKSKTESDVGSESEARSAFVSEPTSTDETESTQTVSSNTNANTQTIDKPQTKAMNPVVSYLLNKSLGGRLPNQQITDYFVQQIGQRVG